MINNSAASKKFVRHATREVAAALENRIPLLHVLSGPRQVGKSTAADQIINSSNLQSHYASADSAIPHSSEWIEAQWRNARLLARNGRTLLVLDEIQKVRGWSEIVKLLWDEDRREDRGLDVILLGSASLLLQEGLSESLSGRFLLHPFTHWSWSECKEAFDWSLEQWFIYGGYPGAAPFIADEKFWKRYVNDSLIETVLSRDVLQLHTVRKPALLRNLFGLATTFPSRILSYNKMLGQLQESGNTTTLAHYLHLLASAYLVSGLEQFSKGKQRNRGSSPKIVLWNNALIHANSLSSLRDLPKDRSAWGFVVENAVGSHLLNSLQSRDWSITYWNNGDLEVDYVVSHKDRIWAIEVKSGRSGKRSGLKAFQDRYPSAAAILIGEAGIPLERFFASDPQELLANV